MRGLSCILAAAAIAAAIGGGAGGATAAKAPSASADEAAATRAAVRRRHAQSQAAVAGAGHADEEATADVWSDLMEGNRRFVIGRPRSHALVQSRRDLAAGQHPGAVVLGCSDSRVSPELVFDRGLGEVFVIRTAGNLADAIALGSIEYAVEHLHVRVLVVLGHSGCGAVAAAVAGGPLPSDNLSAIVRRIEPVLTDLRSRASGPELLQLAVEANVKRSAADVLAGSALLTRLRAAGDLEVVEAVYQLDSGKITKLH